MNPLISNKELYMGGWAGYPISPKTMRRNRLRTGLRPVAMDGNTPLFKRDEVEEAKKRWMEARLALFD
jgi:hypothetical protein